MFTEVPLVKPLERILSRPIGSFCPLSLAQFHPPGNAIQRLSRENVLWSAETIHGHLLLLGFDPRCPDSIRKVYGQA
jgi:hypothetical protein